MTILLQIRKDADSLRNLISTLTGNLARVDGSLLVGKELKKTRAEFCSELRWLEFIIETGIAPKKYRSIITKETYYRSDEEIRKKSAPLSTAKYTMFCVKQSRKESGRTHSIFKIISSDALSLTDFFIEHKENKSYPSGAFAAKVKKGCIGRDSTEPKYAIKIYRQSMLLDDANYKLKLAMRATYCYRQFGREGFTFRRNNKQYLVTEWLEGYPLNEVTAESIQSIPIPRRIVMAISLLRELNILHKQGLIHNDIKASNVIVNYGKLNFVDLDSVRLKNEIPLHGYKPIFTSSYLPDPQMSYDAEYSLIGYLKFNEKTDLYAMGLTLTYLFPEIYTKKPGARAVEVMDGQTKMTHIFNTFSLVRGTKHAEHPLLQNFLKQMVFQIDSALVTVEQFIEALRGVLLTYPDYEKYLKEDRLIGLGSGLSVTDGEKAFKEIDKEFLEYNQRLASVKMC